MKGNLKLALKNISRHRLRTAVSISAVILSVAVVVFARGWVNGVIHNVSESYFHYQTGHIRIIDEDYQRRERVLSLRYPVTGINREDVSETATALKGIEGIDLALPRIKFGAMASTDDELITLMGWGVDPEKEKKFTSIENKIDRGRMIRDGKQEILIGYRLLDDLGITVGDRITLIFNTAYGSIQGRTLVVAGRIKSTLKPLNEKIFYLPLDIAQNMLHMEGRATEIVIATSSINKTGQLTAEISSFLAQNYPENNYKAIPWYESGTMVESIFLIRYIYNFIYIFIIGLASFIVVNTMIMVVSERTGEIGMMKAMGMKKSQIMNLFLSEAALKGGIGSFAGALLGGAITSYLSVKGIVLGDEGLLGEEILMGSVIYPVFSYSNMIFGFILGSIIVTAAGYFPAKKAAKLTPTEALREF